MTTTASNISILDLSNRLRAAKQDPENSWKFSQYSDDLLREFNGVWKHNVEHYKLELDRILSKYSY